MCSASPIDVDAREQLVDAQRQPRLARQLIDADQPDRQPDRKREQPADQRAADQRRDRHEREHDQREVVGGLQLDREVGDRLGEEREQQQPDRARDERADRRRGERRLGPSALRHLEALDRRRHRPRLARRVEQDRRRRAAVHPAEVDAREEDERAGRVVEVEGQRQQQRDRQRGPDPRQHADERPEQHAQQRVEQVGRLQHRAEAVDQLSERVHGLR
jgi:hypothetical protein